MTLINHHELAREPRPPARPPELAPPAGEPPEAKWLAAMEQRLQAARAWVRMEEALQKLVALDHLPSQQERDELCDQVEEEAKRHITRALGKEAGAGTKLKRITAALERAVENRVDEEIRTLELLDELQQGLIDQGKPVTPEKLGQHLFRLGTGGKEPAGSVVAERRAGYVFVYCASEPDFVELYAEGRTDAAGQNLRQRGELAGGVYFSDFYFTVAKARCVLIYGQKSEAGEQSAVFHENQHFINNDVLDSFADIEANPEPAPDYPLLSKLLDSDQADDAFVSIKDELLARVAEPGSDPKDCTDWLGSPLYADYLEPFPQAERAEVFRLMSHLEKRLKRLLAPTQSPQARLLMVAALFDVHLLNIPDMMNDLALFAQYKMAGMKKTPGAGRRLAA